MGGARENINLQGHWKADLFAAPRSAVEGSLGSRPMSTLLDLTPGASPDYSIGRRVM